MGKVKFMGLYSLEVLDCKCELKKYISGLNVIDDPVCEKHQGFKEYQCRVCDEFFELPSLLKKHKWSHAI